MLDLSLALYGLVTLKETGLGTQNTWDAPGQPGYPGMKTATAAGRVRTWNNTVNFGAIPKDEKPVNGYDDIQWKTSQKIFQIWSVPVAGGAVTYSQNGYNWTNNELAGLATPLWGASFQSKRNAQLNAVIVKALVKMADAKVNVAVAYAEASKTSDLILDTARRVDRAYRAFRKGDLRGVAQNLNITPKRLHKSWLEYKYGWMPLLMDVKGAAEFFAQQHVIRPTRFTVSASESFLENVTVSGFTTFIGIPGSVHPYTGFTSVNCETKVKIWCELTSPHLSAMQQLGLTNPALVAWELVPFSFVFDWFIQVGDWLTAMTAQQGVTIRRKMYHHVESFGYSQTRPPVNNVLSAGRLYSCNAIDAQVSRRHYARSIPDLSPFSLYPPMTNSFGFAKLVTSLALIQGTYRGNSRTSRI